MLCGQPGDGPELNKANICRDEPDASVISSEPGDPLLRLLDLPASKSRTSGRRSQGRRRALHLDGQVDRLVTDHLMGRLFRSERLAAMLASLFCAARRERGKPQWPTDGFAAEAAQAEKTPRASTGLLRTD